MKFKFYIISFCLFSILNFAQKTVLNWEGTKEMDYGLEKVTYPYFTNYNYLVDANSIYANINIKTDNQVQLDQFQWQELSGKDIHDLKINSISSNPSVNISYYYNETDKAQSANLRVEAVKVENNKIYKLISFNISQTNIKNSVLKGNNRLGTSDNPLKSGTFYKIKVDKSGIFKITKQFLQQNGINPAGINPKNFRIYGNGGLMLPEVNYDSRYDALQENAIQVVGEEDGIWNDNDYALFYAQGPNGYNLFDKSNGRGKKRTEYRRIDTPNNLVNIYDDYAYYFINFDNGPGKRVQIIDNNLPSELITRYDDYQVINEEKFNLVKLGRTWTGDIISGSKEITFNTRSAIQPDDAIRFRTQVIAFNAQSGKVTIDVNGSKRDQGLASNSESYVPLRHEGVLFTQTGNNIKFNYTTDISGNPNATFYFDYAEVQYKEDLSFNNTQMNFRDFDIITGSGELYGFSVKNAAEIEQIWDVSDITNAKRVTNKNTQNSTFNFGYIANSENFNNEFTAFKNSAAFEPSFVGRIENQDLASLTGVQYLMIAQQSYLSQAQRLADYHMSKNHYNVKVIDVNKIYNEFSSGSKDITAIRDFITKLNNPAGSLKYVFLLGDTSYDFKNRVANNTDIIPSYQSEYSADVKASYVTDDYFVMTTKPQASTDLTQILPNIPIGRLPADNVQEAKIMIDKTLAYYNALPGQSNPFGEWRMKLDFVADDDFEGSGPNGVEPPFHYLVDYTINQNFTSSNKPEYNIRKLYLDAFPAVTSAGGQRYPQINQAITNDVGNSLYLFYFGHGGINGWAQERVLTSTEVQGFNNFTAVYSRFPLVSTITCEFTLWDEPGTNSTGEQMIKHTTGGAATMITSSRAISVDYGRKFTPLFTDKLFALTGDSFSSLGDAYLAAKQQYNPTYNPSSPLAAVPDHLRVNFLGDPAMKMSRPKRLLTIDNIETPVPDQIRALDFVKVTGKVLKADGSTTDNTFNGRVVINIFDKKIEKTTLNNDNVSQLTNKMKYFEEPSAIVKASGKVENGIYTVEFYVPKDINYTVGEGRMLAYAENFVNAKENAYDVFTNKVQKVGDINPAGINDAEPPVANLYMNNTNFANGGITDQNPMLLACIKDNIGINSTGAGIGHDITVVLDGDIINTTALNDYFSSGENNGCTFTGLQDYQIGSVTFPFRNLAPGEHQLVFKVWDINNNSTSSTLNFVVKDESEKKLAVNRLLNWPNPFTNKTYVQFEHNCDDILDVNVQIYTITGKIVRTLSTSISAEPFLEGFRTPRQAIEWDGKDDFGDTVAKGTYIFKIFARSQNQEKCSGSATAVEKMVLLK
ncbi:type IX secretion system sortase PorU [Epilithonimonas arachidiradicis]|uniref:Peptidase C25 n=1 Tax=Epilithonimonas arachidiradicis TaxID=1617282 RepID=A0A420DBY9_9FLAO|nr:type IX secretion system sortase PorU [Epilithonimonas arachidiradicis]RKE88962.1 peptidase C25-like protein [Epilithonimonas arachidiradicis]GGG53665.1 peptidase C25 [Epilithonimonas arachidiradicis]